MKLFNPLKCIINYNDYLKIINETDKEFELLMRKKGFTEKNNIYFKGFVGISYEFYMLRIGHIIPEYETDMIIIPFTH